MQKRTVNKKILALNEQELKAITIFETGHPNENPWVFGQPQIENVEIEDYDPAWEMLFQSLKRDISSALANKALAIEHVGSTAVPYLIAKPVIDIDLIVEDPENEYAYIPLLTKIGYVLTVRERSWYQHRMLRLDSPRANLHVFAPNCPEHIRHMMFRDWLYTHPEDKNLYAEVKACAVHGVNTAQAYNKRKQDIVHAIYAKIFEFYQFPRIKFNSL